MATIEFNDLKAGDVIRVTTPEHQVRSKGLGGGPLKTVPAKVETMRVLSVGEVAGRREVYCSILVDALGQETAKVYHETAIPTEVLRAGAKTFEIA